MQLSNTPNPASAIPKSLEERSRIPMSLPLQKLAVPEIPGFHCHWMRGDSMRINQALRAGYAFVEQDEVNLNRVELGSGENSDGHTDLGSRVSMVGGTSEDGSPQRLYLMKIPQAFWEADQKILGDQQEKIAGQLRGDQGFPMAGGDNSNRYTKKEGKNIFQPKRST